MIIVMTLKAQMPEYKLIIRDDSVVSAHIQDKEISTILDRVFPNVEFEFHYIRDIIPCTRNFALKYDNRIYTLDRINSLLLVIKYSEDSIRDVSNEDLIKAFVYLSIFGSVPEPYLQHEFNIDITHINKEYSGELLDEYKRIGLDDFDLNLNYHCLATWVNLKDAGVLSKWDMDFNIEGNEFISMVGTKVYENVTDRRFNFFYVFEHSAVREKYQPTGRDYEIKYLREERLKRRQK
jgi:hypothetical protein